jgi:transcriptional regulator with XRE-family HTH domain
MTGNALDALTQPRHPDAQWLDDLCGVIRIRLRGKGVRQGDIAATLGVSDAKLSRILSGHRPAAPEDLGRLARLVGLKIVTADTRSEKPLEVTVPPARPRPQQADAHIATYTSWRDVPDCPCKAAGPFPGQYPHVWQIQQADPGCHTHGWAA